MDWQYIAGFYDGEGTFIVSRLKNWPQITTLQCNKNSPVIYQIRDFLTINGIKTSVFERAPRNSKHQWSTIITINGMESCNKFTKKVLPFLIVKREAAIIVLHWTEIYLKGKIDKIANYVKAITAYEAGETIIKSADIGNVKQTALKRRIDTKPSGR